MDEFTKTGNIIVKILSSFTTGGSYEAVGAGYGPGIGENYDKLINIVSRASGAQVICESLKYCAVCAKNKVLSAAALEFRKAKAAELEDILSKSIREKVIQMESEGKMPPKKVVTYAISGIDILELDNACRALWKEGIYSESGMGCTGLIILVAEEDSDKAQKILKNKGF